MRGKGLPGIPHMETFMVAVLGKDLGTKMPLSLMGVFLVLLMDLSIDHVSPEAYVG